MNSMTLAQIAFQLRFANTTEEEDAKIPFPWSHDNIPQAIKRFSRTGKRFPDGKEFLEFVEKFEDGSSFSVSL